MTRMPWALFVEGSDDSVFVKALMKALRVEDIEVLEIGGGVHKLGRASVEILRAADRSRGVAVILDADGDVAGRRREVAKRIAQHSLPVSMERVFLLPDDRRAGTLETLLEDLVAARRRGVLQCLNEYAACLRSVSEQYASPDPKGRIYAYCEAAGARPKGRERDYSNESHWDLEVPALEPLGAFLRSLK